MQHEIRLVSEDTTVRDKAKRNKLLQGQRSCENDIASRFRANSFVKALVWFLSKASCTRSLQLAGVRGFLTVFYYRRVQRLALALTVVAEVTTDWCRAEKTIFDVRE
jgi:hypothetical protein